MKHTLKIKVFAVLKDYLDEEFTIDLVENTLEGLKTELKILHPEIENILKSCRFAVNDTFISQNITFQSNETIYIIPPSSGG